MSLFASAAFGVFQSVNSIDLDVEALLFGLAHGDFQRIDLRARCRADLQRARLSANDERRKDIARRPRGKERRAHAMGHDRAARHWQISCIDSSKGKR